MCGLWPTSPWAQGTPGPGSIPRLPPLCVQGQPVACLRRLLGWLAPTSALGPPGSAEEEAVRVEQVRACARVRGSKDAYDLVINKTQLHSLGALSLGGACGWGGRGGRDTCWPAAGTCLWLVHTHSGQLLLLLVGWSLLSASVDATGPCTTPPSSRHRSEAACSRCCAVASTASIESKCAASRDLKVCHSWMLCLHPCMQACTLRLGRPRCGWTRCGRPM